MTGRRGHMKICIVHYTSAPGGIEVHIPEIVRLSPGDEFSVFVIRPPVPGENNVYELSLLPITYGSVNNFAAAFRLFRFAAANRNAIFHGFNTGPFFLLVLRLAGVKKAVYSVRGTMHYRGTLQKRLRRIAWNLAASRNYRFIANSEYSRDIFTSYIPRVDASTEVIYNPVGSQRLDLPVTRKRNDSLKVIYVGRLAEGKNLFRWIDIAISIHSIRKDSIFSLFGDGPLKDKLIEYCRDKGAEGYIHFRGFVKDITGAYNEADVMLFISEYESFGNVGVESILCGTPVIASDIPGMREIFRNFPEFLVHSDAGMEAEIMGKIACLEDLKKIVPVAAEEFRQRFSSEQHITRLKRLYLSFGQKASE